MPKTMTLVRMAISRGPIPVIVGTFEAYQWGGVGLERRAQDHIYNVQEARALRKTSLNL